MCCKGSRLDFGILVFFGISLVIPKFRITRLSALQDLEKDSEIHAALSSLNCGLTRDDFTDLTPKQMKHYEEMYHDPQLFFLLGKTLCVEHTTPEGYAQFMQATRQPPRQEQER